MSSSRLLLRLPACTHLQISLPYIRHLPKAQGRALRNGTTIVTDEAFPSFFYKFVPWQRASLAVNEIQIYAKLNELDDGSGIVQLRGVSGTDQHLVQKMERSHKGSLDRFLFSEARRDGGHLQIELIRSVLAQIAETMMKIHALDLIHRDLKAENVLVFDANADARHWESVRAKVADFDRTIAWSRGDYLQEPVGSLFHMAPELLAWEKYDRKVDIYAFGILMFEVAHAGTTPYANVGTGMPDSIPRDDFAKKVVAENLRPNWTHADAKLKALAERCWASNPDDRPEFEEVFALLQVDAPWHPGPSPFASGTQIAAQAIEGVGLSTNVGKKRSKMEDAVSVLHMPEVLIACVCDGLRDARSSEFAAWRMGMATLNELDATADVRAALSRTFTLTDSALREIEPAIESGSTAVIAVLREHDLSVGWLGDSLAYLFRKGKDDTDFSVLSLVDKHHPDRADEAARVEACGGVVGREQRWLDNGESVPSGPARVYVPAVNENTGIALSRALGLFAFKPTIGAEPEVTHLKRQDEDQFLVLGSDGVFDLLHAEDVYEIIMKAESVQQAANDIIAAVLRLGAPDNASVVVIDMRRVLC
jgi:serine/threonine protein phosphatase PrpC